mgnify:CR=1 FL=1
MKKILFLLLLCSSVGLWAQDRGNFYGGLESNSQWLLDDDDLNFVAPEDQFRSNNYFQLNYNLGKFTAGVQYENYLPSALLGYSPDLDGGNEIATYYLQFTDEALDVTAGYFYEQFGNGLMFRTWEDRQLGVNNSLRGLRVKFDATDYLTFKGVYGNQRNAMEISDGVVQGLDGEIDLGTAFKMGDLDLRAGASYVARYQSTGVNDTIPSTVNSYGGRLSFSAGNFYGGIEGSVKDPDVIANEGELISNRTYDGSAVQLDLGYAQKGLGINGIFRRLENWSFYSDRTAEGNIYLQQLIHYVPALTKQQDYLLTNIYVYNSQPRLLTTDNERRAGEVGTQWDLYYSFPKYSFLGKYRTKIAANFSYWGGLDAEFNDDLSYEAEFIGSGDRYFRDFNFEIKNRWNKSWSTVATFQNVIIDKGVSLGGPLGVQGDIRATVAVAEATYRMDKGRSFRFVAQHLWTEQDRENWAAGVIEYSFSSRLSAFIADSYNYGGEGKIHYYNIGGAYSKGRTRFSMNYGRQRGGLICIGGVCRFVPESNGLNVNLVVTF